MNDAKRNLVTAVRDVRMELGLSQENLSHICSSDNIIHSIIQSPKIYRIAWNTQKTTQLLLICNNRAHPTSSFRLRLYLTASCATAHQSSDDTYSICRASARTLLIFLIACSITSCSSSERLFHAFCSRLSIPSR